MKTSIPQAVRSRLPTDLRGRVKMAARDPRTRVRAEVGLAVALAVGLLLSVILLTGFLAPVDPILNDLVYQPITPDGQVVIISIDKKSQDDLGPWPWPRTIHAGLLERLSASPPKVIAFDTLFAQATPEDTGLAEAIRRAGNVLLPTVGVEAAALPQKKDQFPQFDVLLLPASDLRAAARVGHRVVAPDSDGVVRRVPAVIQTSDGAQYPALGLALAQIYLGEPAANFDLAGRVVQVGTIRIPVDDSGRILLNFTGAKSPIPTFSYSDVFQGKVPASTFAGKAVLVGATSNAEPETFVTPLSGGSPTAYNVGLQANLAEMILHNPPRMLRQQSALDQIALTLLFALLAGLTLPHFRPLSSLALTIVYMLGLLILAFDAFNRGTVVRLLFPGLALVLSLIAIATFRYFSEERRRLFLASLFKRYVPDESVGTIVDAIDSGELPLGGARRLVTVLYCDLRGFSALSEGLAPSAVLELVNRYLDLMIGEMHAQNGTVNKPMGDSLVSIWNAPLDQPDHADRGVAAALAIRRSLMRFQRNAGEEGAINIGLGLATGWAILGNISTLGKTEYTLVGETVNVAARISAFAGNNQILVDTPTVEELPAEVERKELSPVRIRGRKEPLPVWEIRDTETIEDEEEVYE